MATDAVFVKEARLSFNKSRMCVLFGRITHRLSLSFAFTSGKNTVLVRQVNHYRLD